MPLLAVAVIGSYVFLILALENRSTWLPVGIAFNLRLLAFFKYKFLFLDPAAPALAEMYVPGVSTREVKQVTEELVGHAFSASAISAINKRLDASLKAFCERKLKEPFAYLILDARYERVRKVPARMREPSSMTFGMPLVLPVSDSR